MPEFYAPVDPDELRRQRVQGLQHAQEVAAARGVAAVPRPPRPGRRLAVERRHSVLVQCGQRTARRGMAIAHCGHSFVEGEGGVGLARSRSIWRTSRNTANAMMTKLMIVLRNV